MITREPARDSDPSAAQVVGADLARDVARICQGGTGASVDPDRPSNALSSRRWSVLSGGAAFTRAAT